MGLSANFSKKQLFKTIKTIVPKGAKMKEAFAIAAKFGIKKGAMGKLNQGTSIKLMKELKEEHVLMAHPKINGHEISTHGETAKGLLTDVTAPKTDAKADKMVIEEKEKARLAEKEKINEALKQKTITENSVHASRDSAAAVEVEIKNREGKVDAHKNEQKDERPERGQVELAKNTVVLPPPPKHDDVIEMDIG